ncbi:hypothetical protein V6C27_04050 [Peptococcaceae bacterium 1198_IL3148]
MADRCMICGKLIVNEPEEPEKNDLWDDEDDFIPKPKKSTSSICQLCQAKLRKEADDVVQGPKKPM